MQVSNFKGILKTIEVLEEDLYRCPQCQRVEGEEMFLGMEFVDELQVPRYIGFIHKNPHCFTLIMCPELEKKEALG
jgi:hypothetical protein